MNRAAASLLALSLALAPGAAKAGVSIGLAATGNGVPQNATIDLETDRLAQLSDNGRMIYRGDLRKLWLLDPSRKSYQEFTPESMKAMREQLGAMAAQMKAHMAQLPPGQRQQVEALLAQFGSDPTAPPPPVTVTYEPAGDSQKVGTWSCKPFHLKANGKLAQDICVATLADLGMTPADVSALTDFDHFIETLSTLLATGPNPPAGLYDYGEMAKAVGFDGMPVSITRYNLEGKVAGTYTVTSVARKTIDYDTYELPKDYSFQQTMLGGGQ